MVGDDTPGTLAVDDDGNSIPDGQPEIHDGQPELSGHISVQPVILDGHPEMLNISNGQPPAEDEDMAQYLEEIAKMKEDPLLDEVLTGILYRACGDSLQLIRKASRRV